MEYKVGELFCGAGGLAYGAKTASVDGIDMKCRNVWGIDNNSAAIETYRKMIGGEAICQPVEKIHFEQLEKIDGLLFGFPCNDFSVVGEHQGLDGHYGPLYSYGVKALKAHEPKWFLAENVSGLASANDGAAFLRILEELRTAGPGYTVTPHLYRFEEYGVPQTRHRVVVVGIRKDLGKTFRVPAPTTRDNPVTAEEALKGVESVTANNERTRHPQRTIDFIDAIPVGGNAWSPEVPEKLRLNVGDCRLSHIYRRLRPDRPAPTVTARGGGGTHGYHWAEPRALTNRERARIQTFPDTFVFEGRKEEVRAQIGMAVPPRGARMIIEAIFKTLADVAYPYVEPSFAVETAQREVASAAD